MPASISSTSRSTISTSGTTPRAAFPGSRAKILARDSRRCARAASTTSGSTPSSRTTTSIRSCRSSRRAQELGVGVNFSVYTDAKNGNRELPARRRAVRASSTTSSRQLLAFKRRRRGVITNSDYYLEQIPRYVRGELREPCRSGIRTIHIDPDGPGEALSGFPDGLSLARLQGIRADQLQRVLLRVPRRGAGAAAAVARSGRDGMTRPTAPSLSRTLLFVNASQVVTCAGPARARRGAEMSDAGVRTGVGVAVDGERDRRGRRRSTTLRDAISRRAGDRLRAAACSRRASSTRTRTASSAGRATKSRRCAPPGSTTWRSRAAAAAFTRRCAICARDPKTSCSSSRAPRLRRLASFGTTTVEVKSGLRAVARRRAQDAPRHRATRRARCRCASSRPSSARTRFRSSIASRAATRQAYVDAVIHEMIPAVAARTAGALRRRVLRDRRLHRRREPRDSDRRARRGTAASSCTPTS